PFTFNTDDMANPFQLEAVTEYFIAWPTPGDGTTSPPATPPATPAVDFLAATLTLPRAETQTTIEHVWDLVVIEPFSPPLLGNPALPNPHFSLVPFAPAGGSCSPDGPAPTGPNNTFPDPDTYAGVLFLVYKGAVDRWYRWTTLTSHRWEDQ